MTPSRRPAGVSSLHDNNEVAAGTVDVISLIIPPLPPANDDVAAVSTPPPLVHPSFPPTPSSPANDAAVAGSASPPIVQPYLSPLPPSAAVPVLLSPPLEIAPLRPVYLSSNSLDKDPTYDPSPTNSRRHSVRGERSGVADKDPDCNFCPGLSRTGGVLASELLGPFQARSKVGKGNMLLWVHGVCPVVPRGLHRPRHDCDGGCSRGVQARPASALQRVCAHWADGGMLPGVVRLCIFRRNTIRIHADSEYLMTDNSHNKDPDADTCLQNRIDTATLQKMAVAEKRQAEPTTQHRNEVGLTVRKATIVLLAESYRQ